MTRRVSISGRAEADLTSQYRWYMNNAGAGIAERFLTSFDSTAAKLAARPELGRLRKFRAAELSAMRSFSIRAPFGSHLIFYRLGTDSLDIERVMHGSRDLPRRLFEQPEE